MLLDIQAYKYMDTKSKSNLGDIRERDNLIWVLYNFSPCPTFPYKFETFYKYNSTAKSQGLSLLEVVDIFTKMMYSMIADLNLNKIASKFSKRVLFDLTKIHKIAIVYKYQFYLNLSTKLKHTTFKIKFDIYCMEKKL